MSRLILFGANQDGKSVLKSLRPLIWSGQAEVIAFLDNDSRLHGEQIEGIPIYLPDKIKELDFDKVVVCPIFVSEITDQLVGLGVDQSRIESNFKEEFFSKEKRTIGNSTLGKYSYIKPSTQLYRTDIGSFCHIGDNCIIGQLGHRVDVVSTYPLNYHFTLKESDPSKDKTASVKIFDRTTIKSDVYIGEGAVIKAGVTIGNGAIIASKAYITKDVPDYAIMGGIPAKILKMRFSEDEINQLLQIAWWDWDEKRIEKNSDAINGDLKEFLKNNI